RCVGQFDEFIKDGAAGDCVCGGAGWMTDHDSMYKRTRLIGQSHRFIKPVSVSWRVFAFTGRQDE
uniref:hypothetical protein n=1 Tax=Salmonella enterica TaxID=28901 RepID=UPI00398C60A0